MKLSRQQMLLGLLALIGLAQAGDWIVNSMIQGPMRERRARLNQLAKDIEKQEKLLKETMSASSKIGQWKKRSLPSDTEVARSVYRSWLLDGIRQVRLRNATVDSGTPSNRGGMYRSMPFSFRVRGSLAEFTAFLVLFTDADLLHQITGFSLTPISNSGQFDISVSIETLLLPGVTGGKLSTARSQILAEKNVRDYDSIYRNNVFGIGIDIIDPMKTTMVTAITFSDGNPQVWISEPSRESALRLKTGDAFDTIALAGKILEIREQNVVIETAGEKLLLQIGKPFAEALPVN
ncbi:MAG: hypothetical protein ACK50J_20700 [Planctomyces sp.]